MLQLGQKLEEGMKEELKQFLWKNIDVFAKKHSDMVGIDPSVACHALKVDPKVCPKIQKIRHLSTKRYSALKEEVDKLLANEFIKEAVYLQWVSNPMLVEWALVQKALKQGYYWLTMKKESLAYVKKYDKYQRFTIVPKISAQNLTPVTNSLAFY
ncbi:Uncharacterized protein Adt_33088 [Abeliophyllum distichum]|uniref:Uncharacterized protein n=1 Tax=Abeliophyllum distichum TaxID=126358 RepID=A0ABD1QV90_9LAMI